MGIMSFPHPRVVYFQSRISSLLALRNVDKISMALIELGKSVLVKSEILGSGVQNRTQGFRNAANDWNPGYKIH